MAAAVEGIVVRATAQEKRAIVANATKLGLPVSELMRRGATACKSAKADEEPGALANAAKAAADRAGASIDEALVFIAASDEPAVLTPGTDRSEGRSGRATAR